MDELQSNLTDLSFEEVMESIASEKILTENREITDAGKKVSEALIGLSTKDKALAVLECMAHDGELITAVSSKLEYELIDSLNCRKIYMGLDTSEGKFLASLGMVFTTLSEDNMAKFFPDELKESLERRERLKRKMLELELAKAKKGN